MSTELVADFPTRKKIREKKIKPSKTKIQLIQEEKKTAKQVADLPDTDVRMKDTDARMKDADVRIKDADARKGPSLSAHEPLGGVTLELSDGTRCMLYFC